MSVYNVDGLGISSVYSVGSGLLNQAYDVNGNGILHDLSVMSYNVQRFNGINSQLPMQQSIIRKYEPDIIGFQELGSGDMPSIGVSMCSDYQYQNLGVQTNKTGLVSKLMMQNVVNAVFTSQSGETRGYNKAYINVNGKTICWINTHLEYASATAKYNQMTEIFNMAELETYVIITGDFNSKCLAVTDGDYINQYKMFVDAGYNLANCSPTVGFTKTWTDATSADSVADLTDPCDSIIVSSNITIKRIVFDTTKFDFLNGSAIDHIPIIAYLDVN